MDFEQSKTKENLARAFIIECVDGAKYQFIAKDAKAKGYGYLNILLKQLAKNEMAHAGVFYKLLLNQGVSGEVSADTKGYENIDVCAGLRFENFMLPESLNFTSRIEKHESAEIYKIFEATALEEGFDDAAKAFHHVVQVENCHHLQLKEIYKKMTSNKLYRTSAMNKWKCSNCGTEIQGKQAPEPCPFCSYPQGYYMIPLSDE